MAQLSCKKLTISYEKEEVVSNISFNIEMGDYVSIVGENGTGKSSVLKGILGLVPLKYGTVKFEKGFRRNYIGYLSQQNPMQKDFPASVFEVVLSGCLNSKGLIPFFKKEAKNKAKESLRKLGMESFIKKSFADLSGGQKQRVLLARALCATDSIIFLDEPVTGLDPIAIKELYNLIEKLNCEMNITIVMVTHDIKNAMRYSNKILHLRKNDYFFGSKEKYMCSPFAEELDGSEIIKEEV